MINEKIIIPSYYTVDSFSNTNIYEEIIKQEKSTNTILKVLQRVDTDDKMTALVFFERPDDKPYCYTGIILNGGISYQEQVNEELDQCTIQFANTDDSLDLVLPNNTKVLVFPQIKVDELLKVKSVGEGYEVDFDKLFEFDELGRPTNHIQYIITGGGIGFKKEIKSNQIGFVEPTALLREGYTGTNSHTNMTESTVYTVDENGETIELHQTKDPTNLLKMVERQLKITGWKTDEEDTSWYSHVMLTQRAKDLLENSGIGTSQTFDSATLYDSMFKIGKTIQRHPVLYFNRNYKKEKSQKEFILDFEPYDGSDKEVKSMEDLEIISSDFQIVNSTNRFASRVSTEAENFITSDYVEYPINDYVGITAPFGTIQYDRGNSSNYTIKVPFQIYDVKYLKAIIVSVQINQPGSNPSLNTSIFEGEVKCIRYDEWILLPSDKQKEIAYYYENGNEIFVMHLEVLKYLADTDDHSSALFKIIYKPIVNPRLEKGPLGAYTDIMNQIDSSIDSSLFGSFMEEYSKEQKNFDILLFARHYRFKNIVEAGTLIEYDEKTFIVTNKKVKIVKEGCIVSYCLNYNQPKRSELIGANKSINKSYVDLSKGFVRRSHIRTKAYVSISSNIPTNLSNVTFITNKKILYPFSFNLQLSALLEIQMANKNFDNGNSNEVNTLYVIDKPIFSTFGHSVFLHTQALNNKFWRIDGGFTTGIHNMLGEEIDYFDGSNIHTKYTDAFGTLEKISIYYVNNYGYQEELNKEIEDIKNSHFLINGGRADQYIELANDYLQSTNNLTTKQMEQIKSDSLITINNYELYKDSNEILNFTVQIDYEPNSDKIILFDNFAKPLNASAYKLIRTFNSSINPHLDKLPSSDINETLSIDNSGYLEDRKCFSFNLRSPIQPNRNYVLCAVINDEYYPLCSFKSDNDPNATILYLSLSGANVK